MASLGIWWRLRFGLISNDRAYNTSSFSGVLPRRIYLGDIEPQFHRNLTLSHRRIGASCAQDPHTHPTPPTYAKCTMAYSSRRCRSLYGPLSESIFGIATPTPISTRWLRIIFRISGEFREYHFSCVTFSVICPQHCIQYTVEGSRAYLVGIERTGYSIR